MPSKSEKLTPERKLCDWIEANGITIKGATPAMLLAAAGLGNLGALSIEYAGKHKHAGIELTDEDDRPFEDEAHAVSNYADYPNCTVVWRKVTEWIPLGEEA